MGIIYDINGNVVVDDAGRVKIETYYEAEMADTIAKVRDVSDEPAIVFPVVTDIHRYKADVQTFDKMIANIAKFAESVKCDLVVNTGDTIEGAATTAEVSLGQAYDAIKAFHGIGLPLIYSQGNHDNNIYTAAGTTAGDAFDILEVFKGFFANVKGVVPNFNENGTDYYFDVDGLDVRVIVLNACNIKYAKNYAYGTSTASWLTSTALNTTKTVLLFEHLSSIASQVWNNNHGVNATAVENALRAFVNGGGIIVEVSGHSHMDIAFAYPWVSVMNVCQKFEVADPNSTNSLKITGFVDVKNAPSREEGTYTEDAWTVCVLKPYSKEFDCIRFGGGCDRYFHYDLIAPTTLASRLTDVTWSTSDAAVAMVADGVVTGVASGQCAILAKDTEGNYECWRVNVT